MPRCWRAWRWRPSRPAVSRPRGAGRRADQGKRQRAQGGTGQGGTAGRGAASGADPAGRGGAADSAAAGGTAASSQGAGRGGRGGRGPAGPGLTRGTSGYDAAMRWAMPDPEPDLAGYAVVIRATTAPVWEREIYVGNVTEYTIPDLSIDDVVIGVKAVDKDGNRRPGVGLRAGAHNRQPAAGTARGPGNGCTGCGQCRTRRGPVERSSLQGRRRFASWRPTPWVRIESAGRGLLRRDQLRGPAVAHRARRDPARLRGQPRRVRSRGPATALFAADRLRTTFNLIGRLLRSLTAPGGENLAVLRPPFSVDWGKIGDRLRKSSPHKISQAQDALTGFRSGPGQVAAQPHSAEESRARRGLR